MLLLTCNNEDCDNDLCHCCLSLSKQRALVRWHCHIVVVVVVWGSVEGGQMVVAGGGGCEQWW
jgi:hypothetical protein